MLRLQSALCVFALVLLVVSNAKKFDELIKEYETLPAEEAKATVTKKINSVKKELESWKKTITMHKQNFETAADPKHNKLTEFYANFKDKFGLKQVNEELPKWYQLQHEVQKLQFYASLLETIDEHIEDVLTDIPSDDASLVEQVIYTVRGRGMAIATDDIIEIASKFMTTIEKTQKSNEEMWVTLEKMNKKNDKVEL